MLTLTIIGNVGNDAIIKNINGDSLISFSIAHNEHYKNKEGEKVETTTWVNCSLYRESDIVKYIKKGDQIYVEGNPRINPYQDKNGTWQAGINLIVKKIQLLGNNKKDSEPKEGKIKEAAEIAEPSEKN